MIDGSLPLKNKTLRLGDSLSVKIQARRSDSEWVVTSPDIPFGWIGRIICREPKAYGIAAECDSWLFAIDDTKHVLCLSDSEFGRMPISDRIETTLRAIS